MRLLQLFKNFTLRPLRKVLRSLRENLRDQRDLQETPPRDVDYTKGEIQLIMARCRTEREVFEAVARFRWLMLYRQQKHFYLVHQLSHTRLQEIYKKQ